MDRSHIVQFGSFEMDQAPVVNGLVAAIERAAVYTCNDLFHLFIEDGLLVSVLNRVSMTAHGRSISMILGLCVELPSPQFSEAP